MGERFERSLVGRILISGVVVALFGALLARGLPPSPIARATEPLARPVTDLLGLDMNWEVFAPNPRQIDLALEAHVTFEDGSTVTWTPPAGGPFLGTYRRYRWRKWVENVRADDRSELWEPTAEWIARLHSRDGRDVAEVQMVRYWRDILPPGSDAPRPRWQSYVFYTQEFPG